MDRMISTELMEEDIAVEGSLRPQNLSEYIGQEKVKKEPSGIYRAWLRCEESLFDQCILIWPSGSWKDQH